MSRPDVVILAGDIDTGGHAVGWAAKTFAGLPVLYVAGNHEAYGMTLEDAEAEIKQATLQHMNVHFLNCDEIVIDNVRLYAFRYRIGRFLYLCRDGAAIGRLSSCPDLTADGRHHAERI
ncbi:MAG TPA: metallophosphoesterase [Pyrinomonadaceae bacterium]|nr:metallophosphoesterase [Pyrinomonadaceae bacterium]